MGNSRWQSSFQLDNVAFPFHAGFPPVISPPLLLGLAAIVAGLAPVGAHAQGKGPDASNRQLALINRSPLVFYLAKGEPGACGEGCSEWIAADGYFDRGAAQRLRPFLARIPGQVPPIFFQSHGGIQTTALTIGRLMRKRGMTAGVARTIPAGCAGATGEQEKTCQNLKASGQ